MPVVAGVDLGGTAINYTLINQQEQFLIEGLCEHPALSKQGPETCLRQIAEGLAIAAEQAGVQLVDIVTVGLDTPGPASAAGLLSARGSTNFVHADWAGFDIREGLARALGKPVCYLNDGNAAALWGHYSIFGANSKETSVSTMRHATSAASRSTHLITSASRPRSRSASARAASGRWSSPFTALRRCMAKRVVLGTSVFCTTRETRDRVGRCSLAFGNKGTSSSATTSPIAWTAPTTRFRVTPSRMRSRISNSNSDKTCWLTSTALTTGRFAAWGGFKR